MMLRLGTDRDRRRAATIEQEHDHSEIQTSHESAFGTKGGEEVKLDDLLGSLANATSFGELKRQIAPHLEQQVDKKQTKKRQRVLHLPKTTNAPLSTLEKDRIERGVAYERASKQLSTWQPVVIHHRRAKNLSFPLMRENHAATETSADLIASHEMENGSALEQSIASILKQSGFDEEAIQNYEKVTLAKLDKDEARKRTAELRKMRSLLLYQELKQKRWKKIKSRSFRKVRKKQRERQKEQILEQLKLIDPELAREAELREERKRAKERMTLKHSRHSRWAKRVLQRGIEKADDNTLDALKVQKQISDRLRRKMKSIDDRSSDASSSDDDDREEAYANYVRERMAKGESLSAILEDSADKFANGQQEEEQSSLMKMKFMQRGMQKQKKEYLELLQKDDDGDLSSIDSSSSSDIDPELQQVRSSSSSSSDDDDGGKMIDQAKKEARRQSKEARRQSKQNQKNDRRSSKALSPPEKLLRAQQNIKRVDGNQQQIDQVALSSGRQTRVSGAPLSVDMPESKFRFEVPMVDNDPAAQDIVENPQAQEALDIASKLLNQTKSDQLERDARQSPQTPPDQLDLGSDRLLASLQDVSSSDVSDDNDEMILLETPKRNAVELPPDAPNPWMKPVDHQQQQVTRRQHTSAKQQLDPSKSLVSNANDATTFQLGDDDAQQELIRRAFSAVGDHLDEEFKKEKEALEAERDAAEQDDQQVGNALPGWDMGWVGAGIDPKQAAQRQARHKRKRNNSKERTKQRKQQKVTLRHVIVTQRQDKKVRKYQVPGVPYGFGTPQNYERSLSMPLGKEWNTTNTFVKNIRPTVTVKPGVLIEPLSEELKKREANQREKTKSKQSQRRKK